MSDIVSSMQAPASFEHVMRLTHAATRTAFAHDQRLLITTQVTSVGDIDRLSVDGAIISDATPGDPQLDLFAEAGIPVVTLERHPRHPEHRFHVNADNAGNAVILLDHLASAGAERIALLLPDWSGFAWMTETIEAYSRWCDRRRQEPIIEITSAVDVPGAAYERVLRLLSRPQPPDALLASTEGFAGGALRAARQLGLSVPDDLLIASGNDTTAAKVADPPITALELNSDQHGRRAVELLIEMIEGRNPRGPIIVPSKLNVRASTTPETSGASSAASL
jgi:DNA-binding LacI/PurR family transcriptional regulator